MNRYDNIKAQTPKGFKFVSTLPMQGVRDDEALVFSSIDGGLKIIVSEEPRGPGRTFLHLSFSRRSRTPSYEDLDWVRKAFIGEDRESVQVFPKSEDYINVHPYTLHLWHCYEQEIFPDAAWL